MTREQRYKYEMFVRVRAYGIAQAALFPASSAGGQAFAKVGAAVATIDELLVRRLMATALSRKIKTATRAAVFKDMKALATAARRVTRQEGGKTPFRLPRRRSVTAEIATARVFIAESAKRRDELLRFGVPPTFISNFTTLVDNLEGAANERQKNQAAQREAQAGIRTTFASALDVVRDLDAVVTIATREDRVSFATWQAARRIEGMRSASKRRRKARARAARG